MYILIILPLIVGKSLQGVVQRIDPHNPLVPFTHGFKVGVETTEKHVGHHEDWRNLCCDWVVAEETAYEVPKWNSWLNQTPQNEEKHKEAFCWPYKSTTKVNDAAEYQRCSRSYWEFRKSFSTKVRKHVVHAAALFSQENWPLLLKNADSAHKAQHQLIIHDEKECSHHALLVFPAHFTYTEEDS